MSPAAIQGQAIFWAACLELLLVLMSVLMVANYRRAARGTLDRNAYVGIRLPMPQRSRQAWEAADRVAIRSAPVYVLFNAIMGAGLFAAAWHGWRLVVAFIGGAGFFVIAILMTWTSFKAGKAADAVDHDAGHRARPPSAVAQPAVIAVPTKPLSDRQKTVVAWVCAAVACGLTLFILGTIVYGYVLAQHQQLVPADHVGMRDATTLACWPRWYASQKAGFDWMLFGYGPVLILSMVVFVRAAMQRRPPQDFLVLAPGTVLVALPFVIAAGIHADSVARAITC
ncbi:hypothetical protein [Mycobacterium rhizamassiliense]|jgi:hypothetical protein|nr:hypothetical protein [Mycobacterium rhizamassiliense]